MQLTLDTLAGAEVDIGLETARVVRTGIIADIPATARSDPYVLCRALIESGVPQRGESHPYFPNLRLSRLVARPTNGTSDAEVQFHYEGPSPGTGGSGGPAILVIEDDSSLAVEQTEQDLSGKPIQAIYIPPGQSVSSSDQLIKIAKTVAMPVERPRRVLTVSGLLFGRKAPSSWSRLCIGRVNDSPWPTGSLWTDDEPDLRGYWLCAHVSASTDRYKYQVFDSKTRPYRVRASFKTKLTQDWAGMGCYRNMMGNIPKDIGDTPDKVAKIGEVKRSEYNWGKGDEPQDRGQITVDNGGANGVVKVGLYFTENFPARFGF